MNGYHHLSQSLILQMSVSSCRKNGLLKANSYELNCCYVLPHRCSNGCNCYYPMNGKHLFVLHHLQNRLHCYEYCSDGYKCCLQSVC